MFDEASLLDAYEAHLRLMESRSEATVTTYVVHVRAFLKYLATTYPSVEWVT